MYARFDADINDKIISLLVKFLLKSAGNALYKSVPKLQSYMCGFGFLVILHC